MKGLKEWKENFMRAETKSTKVARRAEKAHENHVKLENEMLAWAASNAAQRHNIVSGMY